jgi:hypothetical protein
MMEHYPQQKSQKTIPVATGMGNILLINEIDNNLNYSEIYLQIE